MAGSQPEWQPDVAELPLEPRRQAPCWYAVHTRAHHEKKVTRRVQEKGISTFLPVVAQRHHWSDRDRTVELALFPSYTFVRMRMSPLGRLDILQTPGVLEFVGIRGEGTPIPDKEIEDIQLLLAHNVCCALYPFLKTGQRVRVRGGSLDGVEGILVAKNSDHSLVISIELIQRSIAVRVDGYDVETV